MRRLNRATLRLAVLSLGWQALVGSAFGQGIGAMAVPNVTITTNQTVYGPGDRMLVMVTTAPSLDSSSEPWFLVVGLITPMTGADDNPFVLYRFDPGQEFMVFQEAVGRMESDGSFERIAASPLKSVDSEAFVILDETLPLAVPGGFPGGSYAWAALFLSRDLSTTSNFAVAPFTVEGRLPESP